MAYPRDTPVHRLFEGQASQTPDAIAIVSAARSLTYGELDAEANGLAQALIERGVQPSTPVALCLERSPDLVITLLAILKAGAFYVPLDSSYPASRLQLMAQDAGVIITTRSLARSLPSLPAPLVYLEELRAEGSDKSDKSDKSDWSDRSDTSDRPDGAAYLMFTSGSTGRPKGVLIPHRAIVRLVREQNYASFAADETFLHLAPASFDASTFEIWGPLLNGGRLAIAPQGALSLDQIAGAIRSLGVTSLWLTAGLFNLMADEELDAFAPLRQLLAGGDVLSIPHVRKVLAAHPHLRLINGYGPTETTTFACCHTITQADLALPSIPIGKPIAHTTVRILDDARTAAPEGELYIGGDGLALGYWKQPELTAEKFIKLEGETFYRTGDRVRSLPGGIIQFLGRQDQQVKIRGYRIELAEIESVLAHQPGVLRCAVAALGDGPDKTLVAYHTGSADPAALRERLSELLPGHMVPAFFTRLDSLPLTEHGKVDRARLPSPLHPKPVSLHPSPAHLTPLQSTICSLWSTILSLPAPDLNANFFEIGGTSLKLVEAHARLVRILRRQIPVTVLFQYPTISSLAAFLEKNSVTSSRLTAAAERARLQRESLARKPLS